MIFEALFALALTTLIFVALSFLLKENSEWGVSFSLFLVFFLLIWLIGSAIEPLGRPMLGIYWVSFFLVGLLVTLFTLSLLPPKRWHRSTPVKVGPSTRENLPEESARLAVSYFSWIFVLFLICLIIYQSWDGLAIKAILG